MRSWTFWDWVAVCEALLVVVFVVNAVVFTRRANRRWKTWNEQMRQVHEKLDRVLALLEKR